MKQVAAEYYNKKYFKETFHPPDFSKKMTVSDFGQIYQTIASLTEVNPEDTVVDFGCGNGELVFCLYLKFKCNVVGIDFSKDAIEICNENLLKFRTNYQNSRKIKFLNPNDLILELKNIKMVYFCDVLEHMFDEEIKILLKQVKKWNINDKVKIAIHTDNNNYLKFIRPLLNLLNILLRIKSLNQIKEGNKIDRELHVNLTTPKKLKNKMEKWGYKQSMLEYPTPTEGRVKKQLGGLQSIPYLSKMCVFMLKRFSFLSPGFYAVYENKNVVNK